MLSLALVVAFAGMARASYDSIIDWMDTALNPDLFVMPSQSIVVADHPVSGDDGPEIAAIPASSACRWCATRASCSADTPVMVVAIEIDSVAQTARARPVAGDSGRRCTGGRPPGKG